MSLKYRYEQIFMAIAVKLNYITREEAQTILKAYYANKNGDFNSFIRSTGKFTNEQIDTISKSSTKYIQSVTVQANQGNGQPQQQETKKPVREGEVIPGYKIIGKLGVGGMATVFLAEKTDTGIKTAIKILHPNKAADPDTLSKFKKEAELLVKFDHPNIAKGFEYGTYNGLNYLVMEYIDGTSVQSLLDTEKKFDEPKAIHIILQAAEALSYMQEQGYVHKDIKPANLMMTSDGTVKLLDLGFAQAISDGAQKQEFTEGTAQFMSPEQATGEGGIDIRADIYSLGASLYYMVMGELPFSGKDSLEVLRKQVLESINSTEIKNRRISRHMHYFIERMMSKEKELRYSTPSELIKDIKENLKGFEELQYKPAEGDSEVKKRLGAITGRFPKPGVKQDGIQSVRKSTRFGNLTDISKKFNKDKDA